MQSWAHVRDAWWFETAGSLEKMASVLEWALVGSFGRGEADRWSDLDVLVVVSGRDDVQRFADPAHNEILKCAALTVDSRRNAPVGATSLCTVHLVEGLPVTVDWYVYPIKLAAWPTDALVSREVSEISRADLPFGEWNDQGARNEPLEETEEGLRAAQLATVPIAGKYLARREPIASAFLAWLDVGATSDESLAQLRALASWTQETAASGDPVLLQGLLRYLDLVKASL